MSQGPTPGSSNDGINLAVQCQGLRITISGPSARALDFVHLLSPPQSSLSLHEPSSSTAAASACQLQDAHRLQDLLHPFTTPAGEVIVDKRSLSRRRKTSYTRGLVHGTNVRAAMYILLEGGYSYCSDLSTSDMPTYRSFSQGAPIGRTDSQILGWRLSGLVYRASTQVKGQLPVAWVGVRRGVSSSSFERRWERFSATQDCGDRSSDNI